VKEANKKLKQEKEELLEVIKSMKKVKTFDEDTERPILYINRN